MKTVVGCVVVLAASLVAGCGSSTGVGTLTAAGVTGNWQIQSSANAASSSPQGVMLMGALQGNGSQVSGTFRFTNLAQPDACGLNQVVAVTGTVGSGRSLSLTSAELPNGTTIRITLKMLGAQPYSGIGTVEVDGKSCAVAAASAIGGQVANTTGTFKGKLSPGSMGTQGAGTPGTAAIALTQSATPDPDGKFAVTGLLNYRFGSCSGSAPLNGSVSGVDVTFWDVIFTSKGVQEVNLTGTTNLPATRIQAGYLLLSPAPCSADPQSSAVFSGTLSR